MDLPSAPGRPRTARLPWWRRVRPSAPVADTAVFTGHAHRAPVRRDVRLRDPVSGARHVMAVFEYAPSDGPAGPDLVFVHGFRGDHHGLQLLADALPAHRILSLDLPGFGASEPFPDAEHTVAHHADAVAASLAALGLDRPVLVAHSYGTIVASALAARAPRAFAALVLLNPIAEPALSVHSGPVDRAAALAARAFYAAGAALPGRAGEALLRLGPITWATTVFMSHTDDPRILAHTHDQHTRYFSAFSDARMLAQSYRASTGSSVADHAAALALPTLLVAGLEDPLGSPAAQERLRAAIPAAPRAARLHVIEGVGHLLHYEQAPACARLITAFLDGLQADGTARGA